jgi:effector-binding domain-containing protein
MENPMIRKIKLHTAKPFVYLHGTKICAYEKVPPVGQNLNEGVEKLMADRGIQAAGPSIWTYDAAGPGKLKLRSGYPVKAGTRGKAPFTARTEPEWKCLSAEYQGSMLNIIEAWQELFKVAKKKGYRTDGTRREIYKKWVVFDSPDNVTELQLRVR